MTQIVGLEPDRTWRLGDDITGVPEHARYRLNTTNGIEYRSRIDESLDGQKHLDDLLGFMRANETALAHLTKHDQLHQGLASVWSSSTFHVQSFFLDPDDVQLLARLEVALWVDCSWNSEDA